MDKGGLLAGLQASGYPGAPIFPSKSSNELIDPVHSKLNELYNQISV